MELRIESSRGKWRTVHSGSDLFYKGLADAVRMATDWNTMAGKQPQDQYFPVALYGNSKTRVFIMRISGGSAYAQDHPVDPAYAAWVPVGTLSPAGEKPKREVSPETRERLAKNLEKARAARGKK